MTTSGICELFGFARPRRRRNDLRKANWWKMVCAPLALCVATAIASNAQTFRRLASLDGTNGASPWGDLIQGLDGNLYGATQSGGAYSAGTIFQITRGGALTTLYSFCAEVNCPDGSAPNGGLVQSADGTFHGTTSGGGAYQNGTVFSMSPSGALTTLYSFCAEPNCSDGAGPLAGLVQATDGNFYGTTVYGGITCGTGGIGGLPGEPGAHGCGTVFRITPGGTLATLHTFCTQTGCPDGSSPEGLVQATDGDLYGITWAGTETNNGTVFKITIGGELTTLHAFSSDDGSQPMGRLVQATDGNFYGTTMYWGPTRNGTIFRITPGGDLTTLYSFCVTQYPCPDGHLDYAGLVQGTDGNLYGTTRYNGAKGYGTVFQVTPSGTLTTLGSFCDQTTICAYGELPWAGLVQATSGTFYGTAYSGGAYLDGAVYSLSMGLGWFVETLPTTGTVGATIQILGTDFTGATAVTFDGLPASFTLISSTQIQTTVPSGATTGSVKVTIPSGTLSSKPRFRVLPQFTSFSPASGPVGTLVTINGISLSQTTRVGIGGVSAGFTVVDDSTVTATVPTGAKSGREIVITTHGGNAMSATTFSVK